MEPPDQIGIMTLPGVTLFPQSMLPLYIFEPRYRRMLQDALVSHRLFCVAMRRPTSSRETPEPVAGLGLIRASVAHRNGTSHLILQGLTRVRLGRATKYKPYRVHEIASLPTTGDRGGAVKQELKRVKELVARRLELGLVFPSPAEGESEGPKEVLVKAQDILRYLDALADPEQVGDMVACSLLQDATHRQAILQTADLPKRLQFLVRCLRSEIQRLEKGETSA